MTLRRLLPAAVAAVLPLAACDLNENLPTQFAGGTGGGGQGTAFGFQDPVDDLLPGADALVAPDLTGLGGTVAADTLTVRLSFARPIARYSAGAPNSLDGYIELDMDASASSGDASFITQLGGDPGIGVDFYVRLHDVAPDAMELVDTRTGDRVRIRAAFTSTGVTVRIPRAELALEDGAAIGRFRITAIAGTPDAPTDVAPNAGAYTVGQ